MHIIHVLMLLHVIACLPPREDGSSAYKLVQSIDSDDACDAEFVDWMQGAAIQTEPARLPGDPLVYSNNAAELRPHMKTVLEIANSAEVCVFACDDTRPKATGTPRFLNTALDDVKLVIPVGEVEERSFYYIVCEEGFEVRQVERSVYFGRTPMTDAQKSRLYRVACVCVPKRESNLKVAQTQSMCVDVNSGQTFDWSKSSFLRSFKEGDRERWSDHFHTQALTLGLTLSVGLSLLKLS